MSVVRLPCRTCGREVTADEDRPLPPGFPFCSGRCRLIDLGKWADGTHRIPGAPSAPPADDDGDVTG